MRLWSGRAFQVAGPACENALSPNLPLLYLPLPCLVYRTRAIVGSVRSITCARGSRRRTVSRLWRTSSAIFPCRSRSNWSSCTRTSPGRGSRPRGPASAWDRHRQVPARAPPPPPGRRRRCRSQSVSACGRTRPPAPGHRPASGFQLSRPDLAARRPG